MKKLVLISSACLLIVGLTISTVSGQNPTTKQVVKTEKKDAKEVKDTKDKKDVKEVKKDTKVVVKNDAKEVKKDTKVVAKDTKVK